MPGLGTYGMSFGLLEPSQMYTKKYRGRRSVTRTKHLTVLWDDVGHLRSERDGHSPDQPLCLTDPRTT